jgi:protein-L-isoaspartate(D-aspartate) O-methyltransferase
MNRDAMIDLLKRRGIKDEAVLDAMAHVPRHEFVEGRGVRSAYGDHPLPIGSQQTISQPYIVAFMTEALMLSPGDRVLEIGTGSGYQAAILAQMGMEVYTVERIPELQQEAEARLERLGYEIHCMLSDGYSGWPEFAPYDGIIVTAAAPTIPEPLTEQLAEGGRMVIPVGQPGSYQNLWRVTKADGEIRKTDLGGVAFVPFVSENL